MEKSLDQHVFDLVVIGNGIAAQSFLWNLSQKNHNETKSQNFSIAHVYSEAIAPACSMRSSATVSLNGIEEDVSPLGNDMRESFYLFDNLFKYHHPEGVEEVKRVVVGTTENEVKKLLRRYKKLINISSDRMVNSYQGTEYDSYIITPEVFSRWLEKKTTIKKTIFQSFVRDLEKVDDIFYLKLEDKKTVATKKILFSTGAFSKIFERFYAPPIAQSIESKNMIKAGSFLEREAHFGEKSFYLSIDGHQIIYRKNSFESKLIIGSVTTLGAYEAPDLVAINLLLSKMGEVVNFDLGKLSDFKIITGLRHKGPKRLVISEAIDNEGSLFRINGLYKNGYTLSFLVAEKMRQLIFNNSKD